LEVVSFIAIGIEMITTGSGVMVEIEEELEFGEVEIGIDIVNLVL
jgi:hypothetical protein